MLLHQFSRSHSNIACANETYKSPSSGMIAHSACGTTFLCRFDACCPWWSRCRVRDTSSRSHPPVQARYVTYNARPLYRSSRCALAYRCTDCMPCNDTLSCYSCYSCSSWLLVTPIPLVSQSGCSSLTCPFADRNGGRTHAGKSRACSTL